ncbi:YjzD family protein [Companilactobacillus sp.]|uniref:YjzD family protein n=1 Tax=Companilactobacillus sp. TaxID=2767905 RepID=UPI0025BD2A8F|nr:YjzD family protein [Companilactobacillus sp.]MCH4008332.1 YjzD family protein [Companilactobacillus sp.]MCH4051489.1 YjzD family protein [Companilactobacillus sp.]MCH4076275.1 YjzD family protein [Companilactobacillus sp.]MCH4124850.1 YjzD family protein [Companilactobacillus sp.]MCH4131392.1 YjzD family protein [Companilactobacillus sp.]
MRYVAVFFWAIVLGQVAGFIGGALNQQTYNFQMTLIVSIIFAFIFSFIPLMLKDKNSTKKKDA